MTHGYTENSRGIGMADMVRAMQTGRAHRCNERLAYHVLDIMHACQESATAGSYLTLGSTCERPAMMPAGLADGEIDQSGSTGQFFSKRFFGRFKTTNSSGAFGILGLGEASPPRKWWMMH